MAASCTGSSKTSLGGWQRSAGTHINLNRHAQCPSERLEDRLCLMMCVTAFQVVDVHGNQRVVYKSLEELMYQIDVEVADQPPSIIDRILQSRSPREVNDHPRQGLVQ